MHKICFIINLFHASTCFEHHVLIVRRSKIVLCSLWYHHTYRCDIITPIGVMIFFRSKIVLCSVWYHHTYRCDITPIGVMIFLTS